ncbi:interferon regulatory factor 3 isoform X2 [Podarcis raffonei]|uniref:interferon regulatory factor 3 isoform X2 n=1 Tax=Podarcis raffonei TaxID=65483 RepID=UPI0023291DAF|nr:interferon regulatory factor 3 isoform X2 [Podarcis raffonei]
MALGTENRKLLSQSRDAAEKAKRLRFAARRRGRTSLDGGLGTKAILTVSRMGTQRPLIVPWLMEQLDARRYPGLSWLNPERTLFRVPWKHGSRQNICDEDFQLFEDWAIARGRHRPGIDQRTPSEWKRNFRSALNRKEGIRMFQDNSTDSEDPHKVFEILHAPNLNDSAQGAAVGDVSPTLSGSTGLCGDSSSPSQGDTLESMLSSLEYCSPTEGAENLACSGGLPPFSLDTNLPVIAEPQLDQILGADTFGAENPAFCGGLPSSELNLVPPTTAASPLQNLLSSATFESDFEVRVYYRGRLVLADVFKNVRGLCFVPPGSQGHYPDLADVVLPDPVCLNDSLQVTYTQRLLRGVAPGVVLRIEGITLCGMRQGHCHVSWSQSEMPEDKTPHGALLKEQLGPIYSLQQFVQDLVGYMEGSQGSPKYTLWLCFGEDWPDTRRPWKKKLLMVEVIPKTLEALYELSQSSGASSLNGAEPDLRISDSLQGSFLGQLREWQEKMEVQFN